eukprot:SAG31_NODE_7634_length_1634_cov_1.302932_1_plen_118_part_00
MALSLVEYTIREVLHLAISPLLLFLYFLVSTNCVVDLADRGFGFDRQQKFVTLPKGSEVGPKGLAKTYYTGRSNRLSVEATLMKVVRGSNANSRQSKYAKIGALIISPVPKYSAVLQ